MNIKILRKNKKQYGVRSTEYGVKSKRRTPYAVRRTENGFTLLEIMVAIAILAISLTTILTFHGNTMITSGRAEKMTEAAMLARQKMSEIELDIEKGMKKGEFPDEKTGEGNFEEPFSGYKWKMAIKNVKLPAPIKGDENSMEGMVGRQLTEEIAKIVREIKLEVLWDELGEEQSINVVTHVVKL